MQMGWLGLSGDGKPKKPCVLPRMEGTFPFHAHRAQAAPAQAAALQSGVRGEGPGSTVMHSKVGALTSYRAAKQVLGKLTQTIF